MEIKISITMPSLVLLLIVRLLLIAINDIIINENKINTLKPIPIIIEPLSFILIALKTIFKDNIKQNIMGIYINKINTSDTNIPKRNKLKIRKIYKMVLGFIIS
jgi:NADH:ubiquinone oxidoreductase subunit K